MDYFSVGFRTLFFYIFAFIIYRIMGKREIGRLGVIDLVVSIMIAELMAISIENFKESMLYTVIPIIILFLIEILSAFFALKSSKFRTFLDGNPSLIIKNGKIMFKEMVKQRYSLEDLLMQLRDKSIKSIEDVEYAILESGGTLSIFKYSDIPKGEYPLPLILDGVIDENSLKDLKKNKEYVLNMLDKENVTLDEVFYAFFKENKTFIIRKSELK